MHLRCLSKVHHTQWERLNYESSTSYIPENCLIYGIVFRTLVLNLSQGYLDDISDIISKYH